MGKVKIKMMVECEVDLDTLSMDQHRSLEQKVKAEVERYRKHPEELLLKDGKILSIHSEIVPATGKSHELLPLDHEIMMIPTYRLGD